MNFSVVLPYNKGQATYLIDDRSNLRFTAVLQEYSGAEGGPPREVFFIKEKGMLIGNSDDILIIKAIDEQIGKTNTYEGYLKNKKHKE